MYSFTNLPAGSYVITVGTGPAGSTPSTPTMVNVILPDGINYLEADFGFEPFAENPAIVIIKGSSLDLGTDGLANVGDIITYSYQVSNTGNVTLTNVTVAETAANFTGTGTLPIPLFVSSDMGSTAGTLNVGETASYEASYTLTALDIAAGGIDNQALATGTSPTSTLVEDNSDSSNPADPNETGTPSDPNGNDPTNTSIPLYANISIDKHATDGSDTQIVIDGGDASFEIVVTNNGSENLCSVSVSDALGLTCEATYTDNTGILTPGTSWTYNCIVSGTTETYINSAQVNAIGCSSGNATFDEDPSVVIVPCPINPTCPDLTVQAPAVVISSNSNCDSGTLSGGIIAQPATACPVGSTLQYSTNGINWSTVLPIYDQDGPAQTIFTRCNCDNIPQISSPYNVVNTIPGSCTTCNPGQGTWGN